MSERAENNADAASVNRSILWRRLDQPGHEAALIFFRDDLWRLSGAAVFAYEGQPCRLDYLVLCDRAWQTLSVKVAGWIGCEPVEIDISTDADHRWWLDHRECPDVTGSIDVDLNFSPVTNLLPLRRLDLAEGRSASVRAAWLHFPSFTLRPLEQTYRRVGDRKYLYQSGGGEFATEIDVDDFGLVVCYPGFWQMEPTTIVTRSCTPSDDRSP